MAAIASQIYFRFPVWPHLTFWKPKAIGTPKFYQISQSTAEILLLLVSENKLPPYSNSISGFDFDLFTVIGMWFLVGIPNFVGMESGHPRQSYDVKAIFKMAAVTHVGFGLW